MTVHKSKARGGTRPDERTRQNSPRQARPQTRPAQTSAKAGTITSQIQCREVDDARQRLLAETESAAEPLVECVSSKRLLDSISILRRVPAQPCGEDCRDHVQRSPKSGSAGRLDCQNGKWLILPLNRFRRQRSCRDLMRQTLPGNGGHKQRVSDLLCQAFDARCDVDGVAEVQASRPETTRR
jgi:hypothetical protein